MSGTVAVPARKPGRQPAFARALMHLDKPENTIVDWEFGKDVAENRNALVARALEHGSEWVLFLDDDGLFEPDLLERLLAHEQPVVGALVLKRSPPFHPAAISERRGSRFCPLPLLDHGPDELVSVLGVGMAATLIRREALDAIEPPWFVWGRDLPDLGLRPVGEDYTFGMRVNAAGLSVYVDLATRVGHICELAGHGPAPLVAVWPEHDEQGWAWRLTGLSQSRGGEQPASLPFALAHARFYALLTAALG